MHSNRYTFMYAIGLSILTAVVLVLTSEQLKPMQEANVALDTKKNILQSVLVYETDGKVIEDIYGKSVQELVIDSEGNTIEGIDAKSVAMKNQVKLDPSKRQMPLYIYTKEDGSKAYVVPLYGIGLWGPIWGYISVEDDFNTVYGAYFDHKTETPGLGAEISEKAFQDQFKNKKMMDGNNFISVNVEKTSAKTDFGDDYRVDAISGGTITSNGVDNMIENCLEPYLTYFEKIKTTK